MKKMIFIALMIATLTAVAHADLISHWKFDEGSGTKAYDSAGSNDGIVYGATWTTGKIGGALSFGEYGYAGYVLVGDKADLEQQAFTLSFYAMNQDPFAFRGGGIAKGYILGNVYEFSYKVDFHTGYVSAGITNTSNEGFGLNFPLADTDWHMWTMTVGDGTLIFYEDGDLLGSTGYTGTIDYTKSNNNFVIGARDNGDYSFSGIIDDVRFYDRVLSQSEIRALVVVPEPATLLLLGLGSLAFLRKRRA